MPPMSLRPLAALAALWLTLSACGSGRLTACARDRDCPVPQTCEGGVCVNSGCGVGAPTCVDDSACARGQHCAAGCCVAGQPGTCARDADCASQADTPVCDTVRSACVACVSARDCGPGRLCTGNACVGQPGCYSAADCRDPAKAACDVATRTCVECLSANDCQDPVKHNCDATHTCVGDPKCTSDAGCRAPTPRCEKASGACVTCLANADCAAPLVCSTGHICVQPAATTCVSDEDCASNPDGSHCKPGTATTPGKCVACTAPEHCAPGKGCAADGTCVAIVCAKDADCTNPATPRCDLIPKACVACLTSADCPGGGLCKADRTCEAPAASCKKDDDCAADVGRPHCRLAGTATNSCVECRNAGECGAGVTCPDDCGAQGLCTAANTCVSIACKDDADCTLPARPHCKGGGTSATGVCVECTGSAQCGAGRKCVADACVPICTAATAATDCAAPTPKCKESPNGNACVQCLANADCAGATPVCSASNTCIAPPPTGCTGDAQCPAGAKRCDTSVTPHVCVQCLASGDCALGDVCDLSTKTCKPPPVGGEGQACRADFSCNSGLICVDEGGQSPVCRLVCDPTAAGNPCAAVNAGYVCEWYEFDAGKNLYGFCEPKNGHAALGQACDPRRIDSCEWNLFCAAKSATTGTCASLCKPGGAACGSGVCNTVLGALDASGGQLLMGWCGTASKWGKACTTDTASAGPDCGDALSLAGSGGLFCAPATLPAEVPSTHVAAVCAYTPSSTTAVGGANDSCTLRGGNDCRTGVCLSGSATCFSGCHYNADCTRDGGDKCFDVDFVTTQAVSSLGSCVPTCRDDADCPALAGGGGRSCQPRPNHGGNSWQAVCDAVAGPGKAGTRCTAGSDCASGVCVTGATLQSIALAQAVPGFTATDGFCLGACLPSVAADCGAAGTTCRVDAALPLTPLDTGDLGALGKPNPGVCWGATCGTDANCAGFSADAATPRVCAPYKVTKAASNDTVKKCTADADCAGSTSWQALCNTASNNPNPGGAYGTSAGIYGPNGRCRTVTWALQCAPSLGGAKAGPGGACTTSTDCKTGHCVTLGTAKYCFGGCSTDADCLNGTRCRTGTYLGLPDKHCAP